MNKTLLTLAFALTTAFTLPAQSKINPAGQMEIDNYRSLQEQRIRTLGTEAAEAEPVPTVSAIVRLAPGYTTDCLRNAGYELKGDMGDMAIVTLPINEVEKLAEMPEVQSVSFGDKKRPMLNAARKASGVDEAHQGITVEGVTQSYTGKGVIVALFDSGMEANHVNFTDADGNTRVKRVWYFTGTNGTCKEYADNNISSFTTDDQGDTHATHVAGIMGGSYNRAGTYAQRQSPYSTTVTLTDGNLPFYGVATEADLAFGVGGLYDDNILNGLINISDYAESEGKPAAINLSIGSNYGPHDGSDDFSQYLDRLGRKNLICISSGNEGDQNMSIEKTFTADNTSFKTFLLYDPNYSSSVNGLLDIWASDSQALTVTLSLYRQSTGALTPLATVSRAGQTVTTSQETGLSYGYATLMSNVDSNNNRFNVYVYCRAMMLSSGYSLALTVSGKEGQTVNAYFNGYTEFSNKPKSTGGTVTGYIAGTPDNSINGMACGKNIIPVGAWNSSTMFYTLNKQGLGLGYTLNDITPFSSYGHTFDGRQLPLVCAPGSLIISSYSRYYVANGSDQTYDSANFMTASAKSGSNTDYWGWMQGTSMACPFVTGVIGLWLQADPTLTVDDVKDVLANSCINDSYTAKSPDRFGYGKIDAAAGLRYILSKNSAIGTVFDDDEQRLIITPNGQGYDVFVAGEQTLTVNLYDLQGRPVMTVRGTDGSATVNTSDLVKGVYVLTAQGTTGSYSHRVMVK